FTEALAGDPVSAFGGIVALNRPVDAATAEEMAKIFFECIIAPDFEEEALKRLKKKKNLRLLRAAVGHFQEPFWEVKSVCGGYLVNESDSIKENADQYKVVTDAQPTEQQWADLLFAWKVVKHVKSNAIVLAREQKLLGAGAGQMSRVDSVELAGWKAQKFNHETTGSVLASDAFFPFRDGIDKAAALGVTAIIQPGGSIRDEEVIQAANEHGIAMVFTGIRHFKH
ncbi:MAG TPA: bifunctional phosphoribosylaminoimidazolecarboxamide formyltransferase/IMP cyclohydrolase, partial [Calditrichae bacterium]|nr:bifunctional phosphoribosylaminoimidazolecarboxamide formyltransferase/IMP cyclohydrolase [Calditrichia bacterium]